MCTVADRNEPWNRPQLQAGVPWWMLRRPHRAASRRNSCCMRHMSGDALRQLAPTTGRDGTAGCGARRGWAGGLTVVVAAAVGAGSHGHHPAGLGHLVVHLSQRGGHLVGESARHNHAVRLARAGAEDDAEAVKVVARRAWGGAKGGRREGRLCFQAEECSQRCEHVSSTDVLQVREALRLCLPQLLPLWLLSAQQAACQAAAPVCIISTAQQARPKVIGQMEPLRALQHADHTAID